MIEWINSLLQGILLGGLYALFAAGLSIIFGVMRLVNIAHGDLIILAAYMGLSTTMLLGVHPFFALLIVLPVMALFGYVLQRGLLNRALGDDILPPLLVTFGLSIITKRVRVNSGWCFRFWDFTAFDFCSRRRDNCNFAVGFLFNCNGAFVSRS